MRTSVRTIALALPAIVGLACTHARSRSTASAPPQQPPEEQQVAVQPGMEGHAADQVVSGTVTSATSFSVSLKSPLGEEKTLEIVPQTVVTIDGREATPLELEEGQEVRASYNQVSGRDVAVRIESVGGGTESGQGGSGMPGHGAGESPSGAPESTGGTTPPDTGTSPQP